MCRQHEKKWQQCHNSVTTHEHLVVAAPAGTSPVKTSALQAPEFKTSFLFPGLATPGASRQHGTAAGSERGALFGMSVSSGGRAAHELLSVRRSAVLVCVYGPARAVRILPLQRKWVAFHDVRRVLVRKDEPIPRVRYGAAVSFCEAFCRAHVHGARAYPVLVPWIGLLQTGQAW